jgi:hypothetical protein
VGGIGLVPEKLGLTRSSVQTLPSIGRDQFVATAVHNQHRAGADGVDIVYGAD